MIGKRASAFFATILLGSGPALLAAGLEVGQPLPAWRLPDLEEGRLRSVTEFRGRKQALHVFASW